LPHDTEEASSEELITAIERPAGVILTVTENRNWTEVFFEGDLMAHRRGQFAGSFSALRRGDPSVLHPDRYRIHTPHKSTVYEHPRTMISFPARAICASLARASG
jgi:hypothetical protein